MGFISRSSKEPVGEIKFFGSSALPVGYLACDGSAVSRTTYAELFARIGTAYGSGDGSTTFNVPDYRGRTPIGDGTGPGLSSRTMGQSIGAETHTLTEAQMPTHSHGFWNDGSAQMFTVGNPGDSRYRPININNNTNFNSPNGNGITYTGSSQAHNNMQPSLVCKFGIKY
jgi:microcystin-dependent protein